MPQLVANMMMSMPGSPFFVVASRISLRYYGSMVAHGVFGSGNKLIRDVKGDVGMVADAGGMLRDCLPWEAMHDAMRLVHEPPGLAVLIKSPHSAIAAILARQAEERALFDNGWLHLFALEEGRMTRCYRPGLGREGAARVARAASAATGPDVRWPAGEDGAGATRRNLEPLSYELE